MTDSKKPYRVWFTEWTSYEIILDAADEHDAIAQADALWADEGDWSFAVRDTGREDYSAERHDDSHKAIDAWLRRKGVLR